MRIVSAFRRHNGVSSRFTWGAPEGWGSPFYLHDTSFYSCRGIQTAPPNSGLITISWHGWNTGLPTLSCSQNLNKPLVSFTEDWDQALTQYNWIQEVLGSIIFEITDYPGKSVSVFIILSRKKHREYTLKCATVFSFQTNTYS